MAENKKSKSVWRFIIFLFILGLAVIGIIALFNLNDAFVPSEKNSTIIIQNQTTINQNTTVIEPDDTNFFDFMIIAILSLVIGSILYLIINNIIKAKKTFTTSNKQKCIMEAVKSLRLQGYEIGVEQPKQSYRSYGTDNEKNPSWFFNFVSDASWFKHPINEIPIHILISCEIDAVTYDTFNESQGRDLKDIKNELWERRFGKSSVPAYPGKTEKVPSFADLFNNENKPNLNFSVGSDDIGGEED